MTMIPVVVVRMTIEVTNQVLIQDLDFQDLSSRVLAHLLESTPEQGNTSSVTPPSQTPSRDVDPMQPGPVYFLIPRKCATFGVCCEAIPDRFDLFRNTH